MLRTENATSDRHVDDNSKHEPRRQLVTNRAFLPLRLGRPESHRHRDFAEIRCRSPGVEFRPSSTVLRTCHRRMLEAGRATSALTDLQTLVKRECAFTPPVRRDRSLTVKWSGPGGARTREQGPPAIIGSRSGSIKTRAGGRCWVEGRLMGALTPHAPTTRRARNFTWHCAAAGLHRPRHSEPGVVGRRSKPLSVGGLAPVARGLDHAAQIRRFASGQNRAMPGSGVQRCRSANQSRFNILTRQAPAVDLPKRPSCRAGA